MAFSISSRDIETTEPVVMLGETNEEIYAKGELLTLANGLATKAYGTTAPSYICLKSCTGASGSFLPAVRITKDMILETVFSAAPTGIAVGNKVTVANDGLGVTATTTNGVAEVVRIGGTASGSAAFVRF